MELYKKYRPETLDAVVGNGAVVAALKSLDKDAVPHAILFTGPSGCGKTTLARILSGILGVAEADYREVDSGDFRGIDTIRDIRRQMAFAPMAGPCRMWVIDECHQLSNDAQNAFLKALEDTPTHVYFVLCTTNPEKLLKTIRTRCTTYELQALSPEVIGKELLMPVCRAEGKKPPLEVLKIISRDCLGSARAALVILDKVLGLPAEQMAAAAEQMAAQENQTIELCRLLLKKAPWGVVSKTVKGLSDEPESIRRAVLGYMTSVLLGGGDVRAYNVMVSFERDYFATGRAGLVMSCYDATVNG